MSPSRSCVTVRDSEPRWGFPTATLPSKVFGDDPEADTEAVVDADVDLRSVESVGAGVLRHARANSGDVSLVAIAVAS
jgi:hypothetical protein